MTTQASALPEAAPDDRAIAPAALAARRPYYWSVRRELWENRSVYIAPLVVAGVVVLAILIAALRFLRAVHISAVLDPARQGELLAGAYGAAALPISATALVVAVFYCLGALHNERRDRSVLFWKSLPVSDLTTVLAKATIPLVVLPVVTFAVIVATRLAMLLLGSAVLPANGLSAAILWTHFPWLQLTLVPLYGVTVQALWLAPIYGWLLMVGAWARRAPFLWAVLPPLALCIFEKLAFDTSHLAALLAYRVTGSDREAFATAAPGKDVIYRLAQLDPAKFLSAPGLWIGLGFAAAFLAATVWLRRNREPI